MTNHRPRRRLRAVPATLIALALVAASPAAAAEIGFFGWGVRGGLSVDPEQVFGGVHVDLGRFADRVLFRPNAEVGFGDDRTVIAINAAVHWLTTGRLESWQPYVGGEIGLNHIEIERDRPFRDSDQTELALNFVGGLQQRREGGSTLAFEGKIGLVEDPRVKLLVAWTF